MPRTNSHKGCLRCRLRKKKCNEQRPVCANCQRNELVCMWKGTSDLNIHFFHVNKSLASLETALRITSENCTYVSHQLPFEHTPLGMTLTGYAAVRSGVEYGLLNRLSGFLAMLSPAGGEQIIVSNTHLYQVALQQLWVRDALIAFAAFAFSARDHSLRGLAYDSYQSAIKHVQSKTSRPDYANYAEELLIATLFLGLMEVNHPENLVLPLLHFEAVGHLLDTLASQVVTVATSASIFHRIASESYIYHVSILSLYYPQTARYTTLSANAERLFDLDSSDSTENIIISMEISVYRILFDLTQLGRADRTKAGFYQRLEAVSMRLQNVTQRAVGERSSQQLTQSKKEFWSLTYLACQVLHIFLIKVQDSSILKNSETVRSRMKAAIESVASLSITRAWTGNFVWILAIMLCAADTVADVAAIDRAVRELKRGFWGSDLLRLTQIVYKVRRMREQLHYVDCNDIDASLIVKDSDTLQLLLNTKGLLADD